MQLHTKKKYHIILLFLLMQLSLLAFSDTENITFKNKAVQGMFNGDVTENIMHDYFKKSGWSQLEGNVGRNGIDGLYVKRKNGVISNVLFVESKYNTSKLAKLTDGSQQMSKQWLLKKLDNLIVNSKKNSNKSFQEYKTILEFVKYDQYKSRLWNLIPKGDGKYLIEVKGIVSDGLLKIKLKALMAQDNYKINGTIIDTLNPKTPYMEKMAQNINSNHTKVKNQKFYSSRVVKKSLVLSNSSVYMNKLKSSIPSLVKIMKLTTSAVKGIPFIGIVAQMADDARVENKIDSNTKLIEDLEKRVKEENVILDSKIEHNSQSIAQIYASIEQIDRKFVEISNNILEVKETIDKNANEIKNIKNGILETGMDELAKYYETNSSRIHLNNAYHDFEKMINIEKESLQPIVYLYYIITLTELQQLEPQHVYLLEMEQYFNKLMMLEKEEKVSFSMLLTIYSILEEYRTKKMEEKFLTFYKTKLDSFYEKNSFDKAYVLAKRFSLYQDTNSSKNLLKEAMEKREKNYNKNKEFTSKDKLLITINKYQNELLLKDACRYLYNNAYYNDLLALLQTSKFQDSDFKLKVYLSLYRKKENKKYKQLKELIINNSSYSKELKKYTLSD